MRFERLEFGAVDWELLNAFTDRLAYQTPEWIEFVAHTQHAEPVVAALVDGSVTVGYFTGLVQRCFGLRILGSPMPGWTTAYMGFNLEPGVSRHAALEALMPFAFRHLRCAHLEIRDRNVVPADLEGLGIRESPWTGLEVDLRRSEDEIWASFRHQCRTAIRKAEKLGVTIEEAKGEDFADDFYPQLEDVFAKQALVPPYPIERVRELIRYVHPTGRLLLLRARSAEGECIATNIFTGMNRTMHFLSAASWREHQHLRPNEALLWHAMRHAKSRGVDTLDLGFALTYKRKWGAHEVNVPFLSASRLRILSLMRDGAKIAHGARQALRGRVRHTSHRRRSPALDRERP